MDAATVPGACLCGAVRFEIQLPTLFCGHCHCSICRRAHGAGYVTWIAVSTEQFRLVAGEPHLSHYTSSDHGTRSFCNVCGSALFFRSTHHSEKIDIPLANMLGAIDRAPQFHAFFADHAPWVQVGDDLPR
jgi:hypothetical protein